MLKNILKLEGAQKLTNSEQKSVNGGSVDGSCDAFYISSDNGIDCYNSKGRPGKLVMSGSRYYCCI
jgi:hypothetical protein